MEIKTKFNIHDNVVLIHYDKIIILDVKIIEYVNNKIRYGFLERETLPSEVSNKMIYRDENECFKSIKELTSYYENTY
jgi:hypothetical protein